MKTTEIKNIVSYVLGLFDTLVLLVAWPSGIKGCERTKWSELTLKDMADPEYRRKLAEGNIGVVQGEASGGIASIDIDDDQGADEFLALNPDLKETLRTRGARGCNVWFYPDGKVPRSGRLKRNGSPWGEWRFNGNQTIIAGVHPSGVPYTILCATPAIHYPFDRIQFPPGVTGRFIHSTTVFVPPSITPEEQTTEEQTHRPQSVILCKPLCPSVYSKEGNGGLDTETIETLLAGTIPTERHNNHERLFTLARRVKAFERGRPICKNAVDALVRKYARLARVKKHVTCHLWRHTCATHLLKNQANLRHVQEILGHRSLATTERYLHLTITDLKEAHRKFHPREKGVASEG